jgi:hypothetical protein
MKFPLFLYSGMDEAVLHNALVELQAIFSKALLKLLVTRNEKSNNRLVVRT